MEPYIQTGQTDLPDERGYFGEFGGRFVPETLMPALDELEAAYHQALVDPDFYRPTEVNVLLGDATKAREKLGWTPDIQFDQTVHDMVEAAWERSQG